MVYEAVTFDIISFNCADDKVNERTQIIPVNSAHLHEKWTVYTFCGMAKLFKYPTLFLYSI